MTHNAQKEGIETRLYRKLVDSPFFQTYREAFRAATGLDPVLLPGDANEAAATSRDRYSNSFCQRLNENKASCRNCKAAHAALFREAESKPNTTTCFAGMRETAIPIKSGERTLAILMVGQVFTDGKKRAAGAVRRLLDSGDYTASQKKDLLDEWRKGPVVSKDHYEGAITLLAAFGLQLSEFTNRLMIEESYAEPEVIVKAKRFVNAHLDEKLSLEQVAQHVGVSPYYFCKIFKQSTEMTLTEYVNRRRVEWAKRRLLNPRARVTEVAFDVGFQSISQFNRSFLKYVGESPTRFRERNEGDAALRAKLNGRVTVAA
ncbi:MAG: helix-turn-helix domain-containing protein [Verrucomicrobiota bacterium]